MAKYGGRKEIYQDLDTGGKKNTGEGVEHGALAGGVPPCVYNQMVPGQHFVPRVPEDADMYDENFRHRKSGKIQK